MGRSWIGGVCVIVSLSPLFAAVASAHPGSGIVVNDDGEVFFTDTGQPGKFFGSIWKIDRKGALSTIHDKGAHWLALDAKGSFSGADFDTWFRTRASPRYHRVALAGD